MQLIDLMASLVVTGVIGGIAPSIAGFARGPSDLNRCQSRGGDDRDVVGERVEPAREALGAHRGEPQSRSYGLSLGQHCLSW